MDDFAKRYRLVGLLILALLAGTVMALILRPFFPAILWATVLSILLAPIHKWFRERFNPNLSAGLTVIATLLFVGIPLALVGFLLYNQVIESLATLNAGTPKESGNAVQTVVHGIDTAIAPLLASLGVADFSVKQLLADNKESIIEAARSPVGKAAASTAKTLFTIVVALLTMFFMVRDGHLLRKPAVDLIPLPRERAEQLLDRVSNTVRAVFVGIVLVAIVQGLAAGLAYWISGVPNPFLWTVATIVFCAIPLMGSPLIYVPLAVSLIAQGRLGAGVFLLIWGFVVVSNIDNILRPFIIGARTDLHPMAVFFSLLGGVFLMGPVGLMAGPMVLTVVLALLEVFREARLVGEAEPQN